LNPPGLPPAAVLIDIEGTAAPLSFVHDVLFPYAAARLPDFVAAHEADHLLDDVPAPKLATLQGWMARDEKITALKAVQGAIWAAGYASGDIMGVVYPDVPAALRRWSKGGVRLFVYSSGSVEAQRLIFGHTAAGDLTPFFQGFFDTRSGPKRAPESYALICRGANISPGEFLFLSDVGAELDAAAAAGLRTCQLVRPEDGTAACETHPHAADFDQVSRMFSLPRG